MPPASESNRKVLDYAPIQQRRGLGGVHHLHSNKAGLSLDSLDTAVAV
jgi:hypothetical protein